MREMLVVGVRLELPTNQPIVLLKDTLSNRFLPIWIGESEATAIAVALQGVETPRPMTHDLFVNVLNEVGATLERVEITSFSDNIFFADLVFGGDKRVSARPSDAIALAVRTGTTVYAAEDLIDAVSIVLPDEQESEVEEFRRFIDQVQPEDFDVPDE